MGRKLKQYKCHMYLDVFFRESVLREHKIDPMDLINIFNDVNLLKDNTRVYAYGRDLANDVITYTHYHYRALTHYTRTGVLSMICEKCPALDKLMTNKDNSKLWSCSVKMPHKDIPRNEYLGYAIKEVPLATSGIDNPDEVHRMAKKMYDFKLKQKRDKKKKNDQKVELFQYLEEVVTKLPNGDDPLPIDVMRHIIAYARQNHRRMMYNKSFLVSASHMFLNTKNVMSDSEVLDSILGINQF